MPIVKVSYGQDWWKPQVSRRGISTLEMTEFAYVTCAYMYTVLQGGTNDTFQAWTSLFQRRNREQFCLWRKQFKKLFPSKVQQL